VGHLGRRLTEAARLGFAQAIVPASAPKDIEGIALKRASTLNEALALAGLVGHPPADN
jgi:DNA repair protein RadA/Sms